MNNYKESSVKWIGQIPDSWNVGKVKNIFYRSQAKAQTENPVVLSLARSGVKIRDISNNEGQLAESYYDYNPVKVGDLLLNPMDLYSGANCSYSKVNGVISPAYMNLRSYRKSDSRYYDYYFKCQYWAMTFFAHGKGVSFDNRWTLNNETLMNYYIPLPSFEEQTQIADFLDKKCSQIDALISLEEKEIEKLEEYKQSVISEIVVQGLNKTTKMKNIDYFGQVPDNWNIIPLKILFDFGKGLPITKENLIKNGIKVISYGQIHSKSNKSVKIDDSLYRFVSDEYLDTNQNSLVHYGDFVFADTSEDLEGTGDFIHIDNNDTVFAGYHTISLINKNNTYSNYLAFQFMTDLWKSQLRSRVNGVKLFSITKRMLSQCFVVLPPQNEQKSIVNALNNKCKCIDDLIKIKNKKIEELETYKRSMIYEYVTGKKRCI